MRTIGSGIDTKNPTAADGGHYLRGAASRDHLKVNHDDGWVSAWTWESRALGSTHSQRSYERDSEARGSKSLAPI
jgi:hypothetical protein